MSIISGEKSDRYEPVASSGILVHLLHLSLCHAPAGERKEKRERKHKSFQVHNVQNSLPGPTFLIGGFVMTSSNGSSGLTVVKFSCKIEIFFSLSHPDGLDREKKYIYIFLK